MITKPMLAGKLERIEDVKYPVWCTPKLDGIRCLKVGGRALSRSFKPIPNRYAREFVEKNFPDGVDGELMIDGANFQKVTSAIMSEDGEPQILYCVFDYVKYSLYRPYESRMADLRGELSGVSKESVRILYPTPINNEKDLLEYEQECLSDGYEGVMLRSPTGPYKCGRSTAKEGYLLKLKRFDDAEATVVAVEERMHNANEAKKDAFGRTERSTHKANQIPTGTLGAFLVKSDSFENQFSIGTGLNEEQRVELWKIRDSLVGKVIKFKYQPFGVKDVPRFPVFLGFRDERDIS